MYEQGGQGERFSSDFSESDCRKFLCPKFGRVDCQPGGDAGEGGKMGKGEVNTQRLSVEQELDSILDYFTHAIPNRGGWKAF